MKASDKITKAKVQLILNQPFFATLVLKLQWIENPNIKTMETNGQWVKYNPDFVDKKSMDELVGVMCHEVLHPANLHHTRRQGRDPGRWNKACDMAINPLIIASGLKLPAEALQNPFGDKSAEEIYNLLPPDDNDSGSGQGQGQQGGGAPDPGGCGAVTDAPAQSESEITEIEADMKQTLAQAATIAKQQGKLPAGLERLVQEILEPKISWQEVLARFLTILAKNDYSFKRPSPRYAHMGIYLPVMESPETGNIVLMVDTSGSIAGKEFSQFAGEIQGIMNDYSQPLQVLYVDAELAGLQEIEPDEPLVLDPKGGGGTDFRPGFEYLDKQGITPAAVVYLTDGECSSFPPAPDFPVLWAILDNSHFEPPFGEVVHII